MVGAAPDGVVGLVQIHRLWHVRLAHDNGPSSPQPAHDVGVGEVGHNAAAWNPKGRPQTTNGEAFLDTHRHAGEQA